jgi:hypothetical protein
LRYRDRPEQEVDTMLFSTLPGTAPLRGSAPALALHERSRVRAAALHARRLYPGGLGELAYRELLAYADFGYRFASDSLIPRLAAEILAMPSPDEA